MHPRKLVTYQKMREYFRAAERNRQHLTGYIVFSPASFAREYSLESRTYVVSRNNKAFWSKVGSRSIFASALDGSDPNARLDCFMAAEQGGPDGWQIERCYMMADEVEQAKNMLRKERDMARWFLFRQFPCAAGAEDGVVLTSNESVRTDSA